MVYGRQNRRSGNRNTTPLVAAEKLETRSLLSSTQFFAVNDDPIKDSVFEYDSSGNFLTSNRVANMTSRGIATNLAGSTLWVVDAGDRSVMVYDNVGASLGQWYPGPVTARTPRFEGIATDNESIWIVDAADRMVYFYKGAASLTSGVLDHTYKVSLPWANRFPRDIVYGRNPIDGIEYLWVVNDQPTGDDLVFRYPLDANRLPDITNRQQWKLDPANSRPTGITLDPSNASMDIWVADIGTDTVYRYQNGRIGGRVTLASTFPLDPANGDIQGIADPPPDSEQSDLSGNRVESVASSADSQQSFVNRVSTSVSNRRSSGNGSDAVSVSLISASRGRTSEVRLNNHRSSDRTTAGSAKRLHSLSGATKHSRAGSPSFITANPQQLDMIFSDLPQLP